LSAHRAREAIGKIPSYSLNLYEAGKTACAHEDLPMLKGTGGPMVGLVSSAFFMYPSVVDAIFQALLEWAHAKKVSLWWVTGSVLVIVAVVIALRIANII
jgi:hypothetical protein